MTGSEVNKFRKLLEAKVTELGCSTRHRDAIVIEGSADELDCMLQANERELAVRSLEAVSAKLRAAQAALLRIEDGTYGICLECGEGISPKRLTALPSAALCIRCQETIDCGCGAKGIPVPLALAA